MVRPRLLELFCSAGGSAFGYSQAGFDVIGVDHVNQPRFPFEFHCLDWREGLERFAGSVDVISASPPCQAYSRATAWRGKRSDHPDLIAATREALKGTGRPFVIENVQEARRLLDTPMMLCGTMFGLPFRRHRYFEVPCLPLVLMPDCQHRKADYSFDHGGRQTERVYADALGCEWMTVHEGRQAIPPVYTAHIGKLLLAVLG